MPNIIDWLSPNDQQLIFDKYKCRQVNGLSIKQFQALLQDTIYKPIDTKLRFVAKQKNIHFSDKLDTKFPYLQELKLFSIFDINNDHVIDWHEFSTVVCSNWLSKFFNRSSALIIVDVQNDFIDGSLALSNGPAGQDGAEVIPVINKILQTHHFEAVVYTLDWHPKDHISFFDNLHMRKHKLKVTNNINKDDSKESNDEQATSRKTLAYSNTNNIQTEELNKIDATPTTGNAKMMDTVIFEEDQKEQKLWPVHCVQNSWGSQLHSKLIVSENAILVYKGTLSEVDSYSVFWDNKRQNETDLRRQLQMRQINYTFMTGVAFDYCVAASALDSFRAGFITVVLEDACRGIDKLEIKQRKEQMRNSGIIVIDSNVLEYFTKNFPSKLHNDGTDNIEQYKKFQTCLDEINNQDSIINSLRNFELSLCYQCAIIFDEFIKEDLY